MYPLFQLFQVFELSEPIPDRHSSCLHRVVRGCELADCMERVCVWRSLSGDDGHGDDGHGDDTNESPWRAVQNWNGRGYEDASLARRPVQALPETAKLLVRLDVCQISTHKYPDVTRAHKRLQPSIRTDSFLEAQGDFVENVDKPWKNETSFDRRTHQSTFGGCSIGPSL